MGDGPVRADVIELGEAIEEQRLTVTATAGRFWLWYLYERTAALPVGASPAEVQEALRALRFCEDVVVDRPSSYAANEYRIRASEQRPLIEPVRPQGQLEGVTTELRLEVVRRTPLTWALAQPLSGMGLTLGTYVTAAGRTDVGNLPERKMEYAEREWFIGHDLLAGVGLRYIRAQEGLVNGCLETDLLGMWRHQLTKPPAWIGESIDPALVNAVPDGRFAAMAGATVGRSLGGIRLVAVFDVRGDGGTLVPVWKDLASNQWKQWPFGGALSSTGVHAHLAFYRGVVYCSWQDDVATGYVRWTGQTAQMAVRVHLGRRVVAWCEWDQKLFALTDDGAILLTTREQAEAWDWTEVARYVGPGYAYALVVYPTLDGTQAVHVVATDGIYVLQAAWILEQRVHFPVKEFSETWRLPSPWSVAVYNNDLWVTLGGQPFSYDGRGVQSRGWDHPDGVPANGLVFRRPLEVQSFTPLRYGLVANASGPLRDDGGGVWSSASPLVVSGYVETSNSATLTGGGDAAVVAGSGEWWLRNVATRYGMVLQWTGQGWLPLSRFRDEPSSGHGMGTRASVYHELQWPARLEVAPGWSIVWRDHPAPYREWSDARYEREDCVLVTPWYTADLRDLPKGGWYARIGYEQLGPGDTLTVYWQRDYAPDRSSVVVGDDPNQVWRPLKRRDGSALVVSLANGDPPTGIVPGWFDETNDDLPRGASFLALRLLLVVHSTSSTTSPVVQFLGVTHATQFRPSEHLPVSLSLDAPSPNGLTTEAQIAVLRQLINATVRVRAVLWARDERTVTIEALRITGMSAGADPSTATSVVATLTLVDKNVW